MTFRLTRRHMLASAAASGAAFGAGLSGVASAQSVKRIEQFEPELDKIIGTSEPILQLADGVGGDGGPAEGPLWWKEGAYLLFSDINGNRRMKYTPGQGTVEFKKPTNGANGLTRDIQGRLLACEGAGRRVIREEHDGTITVMASSFQGRPLNRPNDVVVKSDGAIYFTDPRGATVPDQADLTYQGVYRVSVDRGTLTLLVDDFLVPNGLAFSPDEKYLYVADTGATHQENGPRHIRRFRVDANGAKLSGGEIFAESTAGLFDGFRIDRNGRIWTSTAEGVQCYDSDGTLIGKILIPELVANVTFGGAKLNRLFICGTTSLYSIYLTANGSKLG